MILCQLPAGVTEVVNYAYIEMMNCASHTVRLEKQFTTRWQIPQLEFQMLKRPSGSTVSEKLICRTSVLEK